MSARRGWCPTLHDPMPSGDGLLVRVKPPGMRLSADVAMQLLEAARRHGNGVIELTGRANLQFRGLSAASAGAFAESVVGLGLAEADADAERRRVVMSSPLAGDDPAVAPETSAVAAEIERRLVADTGGARLPPKLAIVVDGGGVLSLGDIRADVRVRWVEDRFRIEDSFRIEGGQVPETEGSRQHLSDAFMVRPIGYIRYGQDDRGAFGIGIPFGAMGAQELTAAARVALQFGDGVLRTSPWRVLLIGGVTRASARHLEAAARDLGMIVDPADPRSRVIACAGRGACASASVPARADAETIARSLAGFGGTVHVSGCRKGCAHRGRADVTLIGESGRYALVRRGTVRDAPDAAGLTIAEAAACVSGERPA